MDEILKKFQKKEINSELDSFFKDAMNKSAPLPVVPLPEPLKVIPSENKEELETPEISDKKLKRKVKEQEPEEEEQQKKKKKQKSDPSLDPNIKKTIFVGNVPLQVCQSKSAEKEFKSLFVKFGPIQSMRFRSLPLKKPSNDPKVRKGKSIGKEFNPNGNACNAYIVYQDEITAQANLCLNHIEFMGHVLRVDLAEPSQMDPKKTIFIGNLPLDIKTEEIYSFFKEHGNFDIDNIRIIRDAATNLGKGFGYVLFKESSQVDLALTLNDEILRNRNIRIQRCLKNAKQQDTKKDKTKTGLKEKKVFKEKAYKEKKEMTEKKKSIKDDNEKGDKEKVKEKKKLIKDDKKDEKKKKSTKFDKEDKKAKEKKKFSEKVRQLKKEKRRQRRALEQLEKEKK